ncbi:MAG: hypothetical protein A2Y62_01280 [Candidatus Fischerbacteria bacterium RBG_13_37_8]|uniref:SLH domain-containing protein n=1 Tax=Candidatus Fischerbacteria bacterium RBG_13_37_8 TaxID=1817863 RepID=A0A1F5VXK2_9BACT|nr:MAG: hypothetical protein A2Y62_01280 [Candidatus Fischerbacteria bacterium RBG_13_37_8]
MMPSMVSFANSLFYSFIETLLHSGVTSGCTTVNYCPEMNASRQQMAKFVCAAMEKKMPGSCTTASCTNIFTDVPSTNIFCSYIEGVYNAGVVSGCQATPLMYCPSVNVTRAQIGFAECCWHFLMKFRYGALKRPQELCCSIG